MKGLKTLIRLKKRDIDEMKKRLTVVQERRDAMIAQSEKLKQELEDEINLAAELADMGSFFGNYSDHISKKRNKIAKDVLELDKRIAKITDEIADLFGEMKKFELAEARALAKEKRERDKKEQQKLDEIALRKKRTD